MKFKLILFVVVISQIASSIGTAATSVRGKTEILVFEAKSGNYEKAIKGLADLYEKRPNNQNLIGEYITVLSWAEKYEEVSSLVGKLDISAAPDYAIAASALSLRKTEQLEKAEEFYKNGLAKYPHNIEMLSGLIYTYIDMGKLKEARSLFADNENKLKENSEIYKEVQDYIAKTNKRIAIETDKTNAIKLAQKGDFKSAIAIHEELRNLYPENQLLLYDYITILNWKGDFKKSSMLAENVILSSAPDFAYTAVAESFRKSGKLSKGFKVYNEGLVRYPSNPDLLSGLIYTYIDMGKVEEAKYFLEENEVALKANNKAFSEINAYATTQFMDNAIEIDKKRALDFAQKGDFKSAIIIYEELISLYPQKQSLLYDYIAVLNWKEDFIKASKLSDKVRLSLAPEYAYAIIGESYRKSGNIAKSLDVYAKGYKKYPNNFNIVSGFAIITAEMKDINSGYKMLTDFVEANPNFDENKIAPIKRYFASLGIDVENSDEDFKNLALNEFSNYSQDINRPENISDGYLVSEYIPYKNEIQQHYEKARILRTEKKDLAWKSKISNNINELNSIIFNESCIENGACFYEILKIRMYNYFVMNDYEAVLRDYKTLKVRQTPLDNEFLFAVASSFMGIRNPVEAKKIYEEILAKDDNSYKDTLIAKNGIFWSHLESEDLAKAKSTAKDIAKDMNIEIKGCEPISDITTPAYQDNYQDVRYTNILNAQALLFTNNTKCAQEYLEKTLQITPEDDAVIAMTAETLAARGQPFKALEKIKEAQNLYESPGYKFQEANFLIATSQWEKAEEIIKKGESESYYDQGFQRLKKTWDIHNKHELYISFGLSNTDTSNPAVSPDEGITIDTTLYSAPFFHNWRAYAGFRHATGEFAEGSANQKRYTLGTQYRGQHLIANVEVSHDNTETSEYGGAIYGTGIFDDNWSIPFRFSINSINTPLRALKSEITADDAGVGIQYKWNDYRSISAYVNTLRFSDDNDRVELSSRFHQRLLTINEHVLNGNIYLYNSYNSGDDNRPYFNPEMDFSAGFDLQYTGLLWRDYDKSLRHRVSVGAGSYYQKHYGNSLTYSAGYSHIWEITSNVYAEYGYVFKRPVYDGDAEKDHSFYVNFGWRF